MEHLKLFSHVLQPHINLFDAPATAQMQDCLDPVRSRSGPDTITPYKWVGANAKGYDPVEQNAWGSLPMKRADILDPDAEFRGQAPKVQSPSPSPSNPILPFHHIVAPEKKIVARIGMRLQEVRACSAASSTVAGSPC